MLLPEDVQDDLMESYPEYYSKDGMVLVYQNGRDNQKYMVEIRTYQV